MHVLVVSNHWSRSRAANPESQKAPTHGNIWADRQIQALRALGVEVSTFDIGISHSPFHLRRKLRELRQEVRRANPDVVHARYGTVVAALSVFSGCRTVITFAGSDLLRGAGISLLRTFVGILLSNLASLRAESVICVSEQLRQALWWRKRDAVVIPDGVDLGSFTPCPQHEARQKLGWDAKRIVILIDAALDPICKGLDLAQRAMKIVRERIPNAELVVLQGVQPQQVPLYLNAADLLLCASRQEGSPNIVKEALACNLPVVSAPVGDVPQRLLGVIPSQVVPRHAAPMADAITEILLLRRRSNGREYVGHLALDATARRVLEIYQRVTTFDVAVPGLALRPEV